MELIPTIPVLINEFEKKFKVFDYGFYNDVISKRELNNMGVIKGSCLIKEVAMLSSFFVSKHLTKELTNMEAAICAFQGWILSTGFISKNKTNAQIYSRLKKATKSVFKQYKNLGINITFSEVAWIVFCSAMIKEKLYSNFNYDMISFMISDINGETEKINVAFKLIEPEDVNVKNKDQEPANRSLTR